MSVYDGSAPSWLFSFVDLAFLSLIAMTQIGANAPETPIDIGEMIVPHIGGEQGSADLERTAPRAWQLRVYPRSEEEASPFALTRPGPASEPDSAERIDSTALRQALSSLVRSGDGVPLLAPHKDSRSQDLLEAASMIEELWPTRRRALISRSFAKS